MKLYVKEFFLSYSELSTLQTELRYFIEDTLSMSLEKLSAKYSTIADQFKDEECRRATIKSCYVLDMMYRTKIFEKIL